jgi:hypothetical protein
MDASLERRFYPQVPTIYVVRYARDNGDIGTGVYLRLKPALAYASKLMGWGKAVRVFSLSGDWKDVDVSALEPAGPTAAALTGQDKLVAQMKRLGLSDQEIAREIARQRALRDGRNV